ncbi:MAG: M18 family aminopeptidase [Brevibacterium aurantiacum]|uniref:M18 family aminopeptidase n=1 Tax=Brevibacterium aurantiacum TaxID=273384 RepID=A0A2A3ZK01_BREAU|nr:M18 family aminopeptidase [Brevibacterium aurantiacum]MDN5594435.1 M18 family aminopeptidase [Brevibacterium sp.]AZL04560.1 M18 family aminopeptidase [Brevibacterium aurantiacum]AZL08149.1 M18 family aminopeptidase [Brevibacterium aurantiacum]AZL11762.1 M18 family aminopeptidase [Brevibacterium aurantiacum]AZT92148.1 M18 family aminopeptidase [Brevibacterium aurantiacum]
MSTSPVRSRTKTQVAADLTDFISSSPSSYHATATAAARLEAAGFCRLNERKVWSLEPGQGHYVIRDGAIIAWRTPAGKADAAETDASEQSDNSGGRLTTIPGFRVFGSHTDSPAFKLKPGDEFTTEGTRQIGVEIYGGPLLNSWLDRELALAGQLSLADGSVILAQTPPIARIPQLAIHLDRQVNDGLTLDKQRHTTPIIGLADLAEADVIEILAASAEVDPEQVVGHDVYTIPVQSPGLFGAQEEFFAAPRLDNLLSVHAGVNALVDVDAASLDSIALFAGFDHEEIGSNSRSGACGPLLADVTERIIASLFPGSTRSEYLAALASSICVSSDAGHAAHPNYPERHDPHVRPRLGGGPLLKLNAQQRYATDAVGTAAWSQACAAAGVEYQNFVSNNAMPCGSTIGPLTATRLGMTTVDVGPALYSMHSAREMVAISDVVALGAAATTFLQGA